MEYPRIEASWPTRAAFLEGVREGEELASFYYSPPAGRQLPPAARVGALLSVVIRFQDVDAEFHVHARVVVRRPSGARRGLRLEFIREEAGRQRLVLACARGESVSYRRRRSARIRCLLDVRVEADDGRTWEARATTISRHGMHLAMSEPPEPDTALRLAIAFPGRATRFRAFGRVAAVVAEGPQRGAGIEFTWTSAAQRDALAERVAVLGARR